MDRNKEYFRLWWEYFIRSGIIDEMKHRGYDPTNEDSYYFQYQENEALSSTFLIFKTLIESDGKMSFADWWEQNRNEIDPVIPVRDGYDALLNYEKNFYWVLRDIYWDKDPKKLYITNFVKNLKIRNKTKLLVEIDLRTDPSIDSINREVKRLVLKKRDEIDHALTFRFQSGTGPNQLQRYLDVYDLYNKLNPDARPGDRAKNGTWPTIVKRIKYYLNHHTEDKKNAANKDHKKAIKVIENVRNGEFPGKLS